MGQRKCVKCNVPLAPETPRGVFYCPPCMERYEARVRQVIGERRKRPRATAHRQRTITINATVPGNAVDTEGEAE